MKMSEIVKKHANGKTIMQPEKKKLDRRKTFVNAETYHIIKEKYPFVERKHASVSFFSSSTYKIMQFLC